MSALGATDLLNLWEQSDEASWPLRARNLLLAVDEQLSTDKFLDLTLGEMNDRLLRLRQAFFGSQMQCKSACPSCGVEADFTISVDQIMSARNTEPRPQGGEIVYQGRRIEVKPLTVRDLSELAEWWEEGRGHRTLSLAGDFLQARCVPAMAGESKFELIGAGATELTAVIAVELEKLDPGCDDQIAMSCPECEHDWQESLSVLRFLWEEISAWSRRVLYEVHELARAYGWSESAILSMSSRRRGIYLDALGAVD